MLSERNVVVTVVAIAVLSLLSLTLSFLQDDRSDLRHDSWGVLTHGHRGLFEILETLSIPVERRLQPPANIRDADTCLLMLSPDSNLVKNEPAFITRLRDWVEKGGHLVCSPAIQKQGPFSTDRVESSLPPKSFFELLGIGEINRTAGSISRLDGGHLFRRGDLAGSRHDSALTEMETFFSPNDVESVSVPVVATGFWAETLTDVKTISVPKYDAQFLTVPESTTTKSTATLNWTDVKGRTACVAMQFECGQGQIVVLGDAAFAQNRFVAEADNSVLMLRLLMQDSARVAIDEFYHGNVQRGNPFVLLRRPAFTLLFVVMCVIAGLFVWRHWFRLGPPLSPEEKTRRSLDEYVHAMARLFSKSKNRSPFLLKEARAGLIFSLRDELGLAPSADVATRIETLLRRRDPNRADRFSKCLADIDALLKHPGPLERDAIKAIGRVPDCL